jgi:hypothetical protein
VPGFVELEGEVVPLLQLVAPLSGSRCVLYEVTLGVLQRLRDGLRGCARETAGAAFLLRGATLSGADVDPLRPLLVDPARAVLRLERSAPRRLRLGADPAADERLATLYERLDRALPRRRAISGRERRVEAGDRIGIAGRLATVADPRGVADGYREPPRLTLLEACELWTAAR